MSILSDSQIPTYWIVIAGLRGSGKSTFLKHAADTIALRDHKDMSIITEDEQARVMEWLAHSGGSLDPDYPLVSDDAQLFLRWTRRVTIGEIIVDPRLRVCLYEAPHTREFDFLWNVIRPETLLGSITVIDSTRHISIREASRVAAAIASYAPEEPYIFAANKQDYESALSIEDICTLLEFLDGHPLSVYPCIATDSWSVKKVMIRLMELLRDDYDDGIKW